MVSRPIRLFAALCALAVLGLFGAVGGIGTGGNPTAPDTGCQIPCDGGATTVVSGTHQSAPIPCVHDVGCGGGAAIASGVTPVVAVFSAVGVAIAALAVWRRRFFGNLQPVGVLLASALFRPPQPAFDI